MLIKNWRDAGMLYEAETGGADGGTTSDGGAMSPEQLQAELERTRAALKTANREAAERRRKLDEVEANEAKRKESELTEVQRAAKRAEEAEASLKATKDRYRQNAIRNEIKLYAQNAGFVDIADAIALADMSGVDFDEANDKVIGAKEAIDALAKAKPHLLKQPEKTLAPNINSSGGGPRPPITNEQLVERKRLTGDYVAF
jgi:high-affinity K+ transport system ATPase subunit B